MELSTWKEELKKVPIIRHENHTYTIDDILVPGVTSVTGMFPKEWMGPWVAKENATYMLAELDKIQSMNGIGVSVADVRKLILDGKGAYRRKADTAADKGTQAHAWIESFIATGNYPPMPQDPIVAACVSEFVRWYESHHVHFVASELVVGSRVHMFGGTLDALAWIDDVFCLVDFKTSSGVHPEMYVQTAGYEIGLHETYWHLPKREQRWILRFPKDGTAFEAHRVPTDVHADRENFLHALKFYRTVKFYEGIKNGK